MNNILQKIEIKYKHEYFINIYKFVYLNIHIKFYYILNVLQVLKDFSKRNLLETALNIIVFFLMKNISFAS